uniref:Uncharacterized protein n=1 Tax=Amphimedon queenslandica TaxID=400682 RepID=A0A1X7TJR7_AMPQE
SIYLWMNQTSLGFTRLERKKILVTDIKRSKRLC